MVVGILVLFSPSMILLNVSTALVKSPKLIISVSQLVVIIIIPSSTSSLIFLQVRQGLILLIERRLPIMRFNSDCSWRFELTFAFLPMQWLHQTTQFIIKISLVIGKLSIRFWSLFYLVESSSAASRSSPSWHAKVIFGFWSIFRIVTRV
jgi:hypothetical protein